VCFPVFQSLNAVKQKHWHCCCSYCCDNVILCNAHAVSNIFPFQHYVKLHNYVHNCMLICVRACTHVSGPIDIKIVDNYISIVNWRIVKILLGNLKDFFNTNGGRGKKEFNCHCDILLTCFIILVDITLRWLVKTYVRSSIGGLECFVI
jgi:hypothetical protein